MKFRNYIITSSSILFSGILSLQVMYFLGVDSRFAFLSLIPVIVGGGMMLLSMVLPLEYFEDKTTKIIKCEDSLK